MAPDNVDLIWDDADERTMRVGDATFWLSGMGEGPKSTADKLVILKPRNLIEAYVDLVRSFAPKRIMELGIFRGGSTALLALIADPDKLVAVDIVDERIPALDSFIDEHGFTGRVEAHYEVDQGNRAQLGGIAAEAFGDEPIDLVLDDASHIFHLTRTSFEVLFPLLRPGGLYVIEDWAWAHQARGLRRVDETPLSVLVFELLATEPFAKDLIADIRVNEHWAVVTRGTAELDPATFRLGDHFSARSHDMLAPLYKQGDTSRS